MKAKFPVGRFNQLFLGLCKLGNPLTDRIATVALRQTEIQREMPGFGRGQTCIKIRKLGIQSRGQRGKAFTGTRFDKRANQQQIREPCRIVLTRVTAQARGVTRGRQNPGSDPAPTQQTRHVFQVT